MRLLRLALKEIFFHPRFSLFFIFNLALGVAGLVATDSLKISIHDALDSHAKGILSADLGVGARRPLKDAEISKLNSLVPSSAQKTEVYESFTMIASQATSRLVELKAIEAEYPFYGEIILKNAGTITSTSHKSIFDKPSVWVYPDLLLQMNLRVGDQIKIGDLQFTIADEIVRDSAGAGAGFTFAPPLYVAKKYFLDSGLLKPGSTGYFTHLFKLPADVDAENLAKTINREMTDPAIQVTTTRNASEQIGRLLGYLGDYLGLAGLVALFLMALGQIFLYRSFLVKRLRDIAVYKVLGLSHARIVTLYILQVGLLALGAILPSLFFAWALLPKLEGPVRALLNISFHLNLHGSTALFSLGLAFFGSLFVCAPLLIQTRLIKPSSLLNIMAPSFSLHLSSTALLYLPALLIYWLISVWISKSWMTGSLFFSLFIGSGALLISLGILLLYLIKGLNFRSSIFSLILRMATRSLVRDRAATLSAFLTLALGVLLSSLIPQLESGIKAEISTPSGVEQPSLFLFDIQEEQLSPLLKILADNKVRPMAVSPMIRSRLVKINGDAFEKARRPEENLTREQENENRFRNRGFNLTFRDQLSESEHITRGLPFFKSGSKLPEISLEERFAERLKVKIHDQLTFDIQGIEMTGEVTSFRKVRWTSFQPNFFIQFTSGPLDDAPKTYLVTIPDLTALRKIDIQTQVVRALPNVSILDVTTIIERLSAVILQIGLALKIMAFFSILVGFVILFSISSHQAFERRNEINLIKILGGDFAFIQKLFSMETFLVALFAGLFGVLLSFLISFILAWRLFDAAFTLELHTPLIILVVTTVIATLITNLVTHQVLWRKL